MPSKEEYARNGIHNGNYVEIENSVIRGNFSASIGKNRDGLFNPQLTTIKDSYKTQLHAHTLYILQQRFSSYNQVVITNVLDEIETHTVQC